MGSVALMSGLAKICSTVRPRSIGSSASIDHAPLFGSTASQRYRAAVSSASSCESKCELATGMNRERGASAEARHLRRS
jgi:hypothetical protein